MLSIEHNPDFMNIGSRLVLCDDSDSDDLSHEDDEDFQIHAYDDDIHVPVLNVNDVTGLQAPIHLVSSHPINPSCLSSCY
jgi:hypothetical protein